jgi:hypothetical protein
VSETKWENYEEVAAYLLNQFAVEFGLGKFEGKQIVPGASGTEWEIDAKGYSSDGSYFMIVECKRHTKSAVSQAITASLGWVIRDAGASGGILVSPRGLQSGAKNVAAKALIHEVILDQNSTTTDYILRFLNKICLGVSETIGIKEDVTVSLIGKDGNVIEKRSI